MLLLESNSAPCGNNDELLHYAILMTPTNIDIKLHIRFKMHNKHYIMYSMERL